MGLTSSQGVNTAKAVNVMSTNDGGDIMVTEEEHLPNVDIVIETTSPKYLWWNNVILEHTDKGCQ